MAKITVSADLFRRALCCVSTEETLYYLQGVFCEPGGAIVATDGRRLIALYDETAKVDAAAIVKPDKGAVKAMGDKRAETVRVVGNQLSVWSADAPIYLQAGDCLIDGRFPDWRKAIPETDNLPVTGAFDAASLAPIAKALTAHGEAGHFYRIFGKPMEAAIVMGTLPRAFGILMPTRASVADPLTDWVNTVARKVA